MGWVVQTSAVACARVLQRPRGIDPAEDVLSPAGNSTLLTGAAHWQFCEPFGCVGTQGLRAPATGNAATPRDLSGAARDRYWVSAFRSSSGTSASSLERVTPARSKRASRRSRERGCGVPRSAQPHRRRPFGRFSSRTYQSVGGEGLAWAPPLARALHSTSGQSLTATAVYYTGRLLRGTGWGCVRVRRSPR